MNQTANARILFVNHSSKPAGAEFVLRDVVKVFPHSATFLFEDGPVRTIFEQQGSKVILAKAGKDMSSVKRDSNLLKVALPLIGSMTSMIAQIRRAAKNYDILYANSQKAFILAAVAAFISKKQLVWHCHDILTPDHFSKAQIKLDIFLANHVASRVIVPSFATANAFIAAGGNPKRVKVAYNGVNPTPASNKTKAELREMLGLPSGFLFGTFSRLSEWKGQHIAIQALAKMKEGNCIIVGDAQFGEIEYSKLLRDLCSTLNVNDRVHFLGHRNDVPLLMQAVDCYVHPSTSPEPFSLAILEAASMGLPIVASRTGGIPEVVKDNKTGFVVEPGDSECFADRISKIKNEPDMAAMLSHNAQTLVTSKFTISAMQERIIELINEII